MKKWCLVLILELSILMWLSNFESDIIISFLWVILHEFAHIIVASKFECKFNNFNINLLGASAELNAIDDLTERKKLILYLAGPVFNILMALCIYFFYDHFKWEFVRSSISINLCLGIFNCNC